jgi:hypothetical protein
MLADIVYPNCVTMEKLQYTFESKLLQKSKRLGRQYISSENEQNRSSIPIIALSFLTPKSRPSAQGARNPGSTMSEIAVAPSTLRSRDGTMKCEVVRLVSQTASLGEHLPIRAYIGDSRKLPSEGRGSAVRMVSRAQRNTTLHCQMTPYCSSNTLAR